MLARFGAVVAISVVGNHALGQACAGNNRCSIYSPFDDQNGDPVFFINVSASFSASPPDDFRFVIHSHGSAVFADTRGFGASPIGSPIEFFDNCIPSVLTDTRTGAGCTNASANSFDGFRPCGDTTLCYAGGCALTNASAEGFSALMVTSIYPTDNDCGIPPEVAEVIGSNASTCTCLPLTTSETFVNYSLEYIGEGTPPANAVHTVTVELSTPSSNIVALVGEWISVISPLGDLGVDDLLVSMYTPQGSQVRTAGPYHVTRTGTGPFDSNFDHDISIDLLNLDLEGNADGRFTAADVTAVHQIILNAGGTIDRVQDADFVDAWDLDGDNIVDAEDILVADNLIARGVTHGVFGDGDLDGNASASNPGDVAAACALVTAGFTPTTPIPLGSSAAYDPRLDFDLDGQVSIVDWYKLSPGDIAAPYNIRNSTDVNAWNTAFLAGDLEKADVAPYGDPDGVLNSSDLNVFLASFLADCP